MLPKIFLLAPLEHGWIYNEERNDNHVVYQSQREHKLPYSAESSVSVYEIPGNLLIIIVSIFFVLVGIFIDLLLDA